MFPMTRTSRSTSRARPVTSCTGWPCRRPTRNPRKSRAASTRPAATGPHPSPAGRYGSDLVSSGAYMYYGADKLDISGGCKTLKPVAGINPDKGMTIVRNPNFDASTEDPAMFSNYINGLQVEINSNVDDIFQKIQAGELDGSFADTPPPTVEQEYATDANLQQYIHSDPGDRTWYITMNLLAPPFDDPAVRRAVMWVV